ncbi:hypothetical protein D0863_15483 [Hortaea werneckii]|uniref:Uncharacterized protein n=1 Tax=Hortaea werneckii TaxID=91943 RepID=A0A3M7C7T1_HORWE|nr:hypothetical protein D0863_15483 [Hortaea werneckii]
MKPSLLLPTTTALPRPQTDDPSPSSPAAAATTLTLTTTETTTTCPSSSTTTNPTPNFTPASPSVPGPPFPTNTTLSLYQGRRCQYRVGSVEVSSSECKAFRTEWVGVPRDATRNCTFAVWEGDDFCGSGGGWGSATSTFVESLEGVGDEDEEEDEEVCVYVGVLQPGVYHGSGVWTCG